MAVSASAPNVEQITRLHMIVPTEWIGQAFAFLCQVAARHWRGAVWKFVVGQDRALLITQTEPEFFIKQACARLMWTSSMAVHVIACARFEAVFRLVYNAAGLALAARERSCPDRVLAIGKFFAFLVTQATVNFFVVFTWVSIVHVFLWLDHL